MSDLESLEPEVAVDLYLQQRSGEVSSETLKTHSYRMQSFVDWCEQEGIDNMNDVTGRDLHSYRVHRREVDELKPVTLQGQLSTLRVFLGFCASIDAVPEGLRDKIILPTVSDEEMASRTTLAADRADYILDYLGMYHYASLTHVIFMLLWRTGMRMGSLRAIDMKDYDSDEQALRLVHRPRTDTPLKNGKNGERWVALSPRLTAMMDSFIEGPRPDVQDEHGRTPFLTTSKGRCSRTNIRRHVYKWTRPCFVENGCPHNRDPENCEAAAHNTASKCPSSRSPHDLRSGAITAHLMDDVPVEIVSDRMDVSQDVLDRHYDRRSERDKMAQRRKYLNNI